MILIDDVCWSTPGLKKDRLEKGLLGKALAFVIDDELVETIPLDSDFADILLNATNFKESDIQPTEGSNLYAVDIINNQIIVETLVCGEMLYSILMSESFITELPGNYKYGHMLMPGWKFVNGEFIIPGEWE
jgi:hypothetical protein